MSAEAEVGEMAGAAARAVATAGGSGRPVRRERRQRRQRRQRGSGASWGRRAGLAGATLGLVAAGVAVERMTVNRAVRRKARLALDAAGPYGSLRGTAGTATAQDGTELYFETEEVAAGGPEQGGLLAWRPGFHGTHHGRRRRATASAAPQSSR